MAEQRRKEKKDGGGKAPPPKIVERVFSPTAREEDKTDKRTKHIMVVGGREGLSISKREARTGWDGYPSESWTKELESAKQERDDRTYPVTQPRNLRLVKPGLRAWRRGVMSISDIETVLDGKLHQGSFAVRPPVSVEMSVWIQDEGVYRLVGGLVSQVRVPVDGKSRPVRVDPDSAAYAAAFGLNFRGDKDSGLDQSVVLVPYNLIGRVRRIYSFTKKVDYTRVSDTPSPGRKERVDYELYRKVAPLEARMKAIQKDLEIYNALYPGGVREHDVTPRTSIGLVTTGRYFQTPVIRSTAPNEARVIDPAKEQAVERLDTRTAVNLYRTISARNRKMRYDLPHGHEIASGLEAAHDPLELLMPRRKKRKPKGVPDWLLP